MTNNENMNPADDNRDDAPPPELVESSIRVREVKAQEPTRERYETRCYDRCIMVFNMPKVDKVKLTKLRNVLAPLFSIRENYSYEDTHPTDEEGMTLGYCFVKYESKEAASVALVACDEHRLDKNHVFAAYPFSAIRKIKKPDEKWEAPSKRAYQDLGDPWWWLQNPKCIDQFALLYEVSVKGSAGLQLDVCWYARNGEPTPVANAQRPQWTEGVFKWSPHGTYLASVHDQGVMLWAGEKFQKFQRFQHDGVNFIEFSPNEKYLVTYRREVDRILGDADNCLRVFDVATGEMKKAFSPTGAFRIPEWPFLKWSHSETWFAFCRPKGNAVNLFDTASFALSGNKPIDLDGLVRFDFNPAKNMLAYYCEERVAANQPAEIGLMEVPSRTKLRALRIFNVSAASIFWQRSGNYLAAHTERYTSRKIVRDEFQQSQVKLSGASSHLEIVECAGKEVSVQTLQLAEPFVGFGWEPKGDKFCVLVGGGAKVTPLVYRVDPGKPAPLLMSKLEPGTQLNTVEWAPQGGWLAVFGTNAPSGNLIFIETGGAEAARFRLIENPMMSQGCWDPTGRYFTTCTFTRTRHEVGYTMYTFQGRQLFHKSTEGLVRFKWRPRPPVQLKEAKQREIKKAMKHLSTRFEEEDRRELTKLSNELIELRRKMYSDFARYLDLGRSANEKDAKERLRLRGSASKQEQELVDVEETIALTTNIQKLDVPEDDGPAAAAPLTNGGGRPSADD